MPRVPAGHRHGDLHQVRWCDLIIEWINGIILSTPWQLWHHPAAYQGYKQSLTLHNICRTHGFLISGLINKSGAGLQPSSSEIGSITRRQFLFYGLHDNIENFSFQILISKSRYPDPGIYRSCKTYLDNINNDRDSANDPSFVTITEKAPARANPTNPFNSVLNVKALVGFCF